LLVFFQLIFGKLKSLYICEVSYGETASNRQKTTIFDLATLGNATQIVLFIFQGEKGLHNQNAILPSILPTNFVNGNTDK
jgi:hypothetical protein